MIALHTGVLISPSRKETISSLQ